MPKADKQATNKATDEDYVGPGHPPKHTRIKKGEVRNPWGRQGKPKLDSATSEFDEELASFIQQSVKNTTNGKELSPAELVVRGLLKGVSQGHLASIEKYMSLLERYSPKYVSHSEGLDESRQSLVDSALERLAAKRVAGQARSDESGEVSVDD